MNLYFDEQLLDFVWFLSQNKSKFPIEMSKCISYFHNSTRLMGVVLDIDLSKNKSSLECNNKRAELGCHVLCQNLTLFPEIRDLSPAIKWKSLTNPNQSGAASCEIKSISLLINLLISLFFILIFSNI